MARLNAAAQLESDGKASAAAKAYNKIAKDFPFTKSAATALFRAAQLLEQEGKKTRAFDTYQTLIERHPHSAEYATALERQFSIASDLRENRGGFLGFGRLTTDDLVAMFEKVIANGTRSIYAPKAYLAIAELYEQRKDIGDHDKAIETLQKVVDNYPESEEAKDAALRIGRGNLNVAENSRDASNLEKAREAFEQTGFLFPGETALASESQQALQQIDEMDAEKSFRTAQFYEKKGQLRAAVIYYNETIRTGSTTYVAEARERLNDLTSRDPKLLDALPGGKIATAKTTVIPAATDVRSRPDYFGPPLPPDVAQPSGPAMRLNDAIPFTPIEEPALPSTETPTPTSEELVLPPPPEPEAPEAPPAPPPATEAPEAPEAPPAPPPVAGE